MLSKLTPFYLQIKWMFWKHLFQKHSWIKMTNRVYYLMNITEQYDMLGTKVLHYEISYHSYLIHDENIINIRNRGCRIWETPWNLMWVFELCINKYILRTIFCRRLSWWHLSKRSFEFLFTKVSSFESLFRKMFSASKS